MNFYLKLTLLSISLTIFACTETATTSRPNRRDVLPGSKPIYTGDADLDQSQPAAEAIKESFYNIAPWASWSVGKSLSGLEFADKHVTNADLLAEQLKFADALKILNEIKIENPEQEESVAVRRATLQVLTAKSADAVLTLSKFYQKYKLTEAQVAPQASLLFGYAYGQSRNYEQSLAWFAQAGNSGNKIIKEKSVVALKLLLPIIPNPILEQSSFTWRSNTDLARLISEERFFREKRATLTIPADAFFWLPSLSASAFGTAAPTQQVNFSQTAAKKIAAFLPLSGKFSKMGVALKNGVELAVQHTQVSGQPVEVVFSDSELAANNIAGAVSDLSKSGAEALIGPLVSDSAQEVEQFARSSSLPAVMLCKGGSATLGQGVYRFGLTNESQADSLVAALIESRPNLRAALLYPDDEFGLGFSAAVKEALARKQITPVYDFSYSKGNQQQMNQFAKEFAINPPEVVIFADNIKASAQFMTELDQSLKKVLIPVGSASWDNPLELIQSKTSLSRAVFVSAFYPDLQNPATSQFVNDFRTRFSKAPDFFAAQGYDLTMLLSQSSFNSGNITFPAAYQGISGVAKATSYGEIERELKVLQLSKGTIVPFAGLPAERAVISSAAGSETEEQSQQFNDPVVSE